MKASWFICKQMLRFIERMFRYSVFPSLVTAEGINKTHDEWHDSSLCLSPTLIFSGWCQCLQTVAVLSNRWKMFHLLYSCPTFELSVWRLSFLCHTQSFFVNPFIHLLVLPASRQLCWEHGTRAVLLAHDGTRCWASARCCFRDTRVLYCITTFSSREERWRMRGDIWIWSRDRRLFWKRSGQNWLIGYKLVWNNDLKMSQKIVGSKAAFGQDSMNIQIKHIYFNKNHSWSYY